MSATYTQPPLFTLDDPAPEPEKVDWSREGFEQRKMPDRTWLRSFMVVEQLPPETVPLIYHKCPKLRRT